MLQFLYKDMKLSLQLLISEYQPIKPSLETKPLKPQFPPADLQQCQSSLYLQLTMKKQTSDGKDPTQISQAMRTSLMAVLFLPKTIEAYFWLYTFYCLYSVLKTIVLIPLDLLLGIVNSVLSILQLYKSKHNSLFSVLILLGTYVFVFNQQDIQLLDVSYLYHTFRGQSTLKLYGLIFAFEISEKILTMMGQYLIENLERISEKNYQKIWEEVPQAFVSLLYMLLHTFSIYLEFNVYMVVINSSMQNFIIFFFVINLTKMKSTAFKKFELKSYKNQINYDAKDRMQKMVYIILFQLSQIERTIPDISQKLGLIFLVGSLIEYFKHTTVLALSSSLHELKSIRDKMVGELYFGKRAKSIIRCIHWDFTVIPFCIFLLKMTHVILLANFGIDNSVVIKTYLIMVGLVLGLKIILEFVAYLWLERIRNEATGAG